VRTISRKGWIATSRVTSTEKEVIPFFERNPLLSSKNADFEKFASIVREQALGHHRTVAGFGRLLDRAVSMNGGGVGIGRCNGLSC